jgi:hypothetical protein
MDVEKPPNQWNVLNDYLKTLITLSSGLLAITVTFMGQFLSSQGSHLPATLLIAAWAFLVITIVLSILSAAFLISFLRTGTRERPAIMMANGAFFALFVASLLLVGLGATRAVSEAKSMDVQTAITTTLSTMPKTSTTSSQWQIKSLEFEQATKEYKIVVVESLSQSEYVVVLDGTSNAIKSIIRLP